MILLLFLIGPALCFGQNILPSVGSWREHLPYHSAIDVTATDSKVFCATPYSLFSVDIKSKEITRLSKVSGLSETGVSGIQFDMVSKKLFVAYSNSNIDVIDHLGIHNLPDLKRASISGDKSIYQIFPDNTICYLATGLGVILLDEEKLQVKDSWFIGSTGGYVRVNGFAKTDNFLYAATEEGLKKISATASHPEDYTNWQVLSGSGGLSASACKAVAAIGNNVYVLQNDSIFMENGPNWNLFFNNGWPVVSLKASENKIMVCQRTIAGDSRVVVLKSDGSVSTVIQKPDVISFPEKCISLNNEFWIGDLYGCLSHWSGTSFEQYKLNSPEDIATGEMVVYNSTFYGTAGSINDSWNYQYNRNGIYKFSDGIWANYNQFRLPILDSMMDFITVAVDPRDQSVWCGSFGGGLLHIHPNDQLEILKQNTPISESIGDPGSYRVSGLTFDSDNNLWISNFGADHEVLVMKNNGQWLRFSIPFSLSGNGAGQIVIDDANQKWIISPSANGLIVYNNGKSIEDINDDKWKQYLSGIGNGNLPSNHVFCIAKDKSGFIWIGTSNGVAVVQCPEISISNGCEAILPVIQENNFTNYLFSGMEVRAISVDGANRKWMATSNGVWLISSGGDNVISHFTEENSALLSNDVRKIAIDGTTGEVFFGTSKGICSFRGTATEAAENNGNALVFPNPVPPGYNGIVSIRGLPENSIIKITELNGRLVYQSRTLGGQANWNGKDYTGRQVSSGIYLVFAEDENKQQKAFARIVFISNNR